MTDAMDDREATLVWERDGNTKYEPHWVGPKESPDARVRPVWDYASSSSRPVHWIASVNGRSIGRFGGVREAKLAATAAIRSKKSVRS